MTKPILAEGHSLPTRPSHWAIQFRDPATKKLVATRTTWDKTIDPQDASQQCFGTKASPNFTFFNLGTTVSSARKMLRQLPD